MVSAMTPARRLWLPILLNTNQFLAHDSRDVVILYDLNGKAIRKFVPRSGHVDTIAVTPDEKYLLIEADDGSLQLCEIQSGVTKWFLAPNKTGLDYGHGASFSADGQSFIICANAQALVMKTATGRRVVSVHFDDSEKHEIASAALSPDGSKGVFVAWLWGQPEGQVYTFDTSTGTAHATGIAGSPGVQYSSDGKYVALSASNSRSQLRVIHATGAIWSYVDIGHFGSISGIRPTRDGKFLITADDKSGVTEGEICVPDTATMKEIWRSSLSLKGLFLTDFDAESMIGVSTDADFSTTVINLRTGTSKLVVDNSKNYPTRQPDLPKVASHGCGAIGPAEITGMALLLSALALISCRRV
jgi:WD40 repeat protein